MKLDWQAYLDGSLSAEDQTRAEKLLQEDAASRQELEGLKSFVSSVRSAGLKEDIPMDRLMALLPTAEPKRKEFSWPRVGWLSALAAAAMLAVLMLRPTNEGGSEDFQLYTSDPVVAANWASKKLSMSVPALDLGPDAPIYYVHESGDHCCFDYKVNGKTYHLNVRAKGSFANEKGTPIKLRNGQQAFMRGGVQWTQGDYSIYLVGPDGDTALDLANRASLAMSRRA